MGKVAIYLPSLEGGGAERVTILLANALARRGHDVDLVLANAHGTYLGEVSCDLRIVDLGKRRVVASLPALVRYLRRECPDALLSGLGHANIIAILARRIAGRSMRLVVTEHNSILRGLDTLKGRVIKRLMQGLYPQADVIVCVSNGIEDELRDVLGLPANRLRTLYNPVDVDGIQAQSRDRPDHPWFRPGQPPVIIGAGRLTEQKDFATLLRAFARVRRTCDVRLVILGEGPDRAKLEGLAAEQGIAVDVLMPGFQKNPYGWMGASALYVMSSAWEGLPGVLLEAMACGLPIVSTNCRTGPDEILEGGRWGRLVPVGDDVQLANAIEATLREPVHSDTYERICYFRTENAVAAYEAVLFD